MKKDNKRQQISRQQPEKKHGKRQQTFATLCLCGENSFSKTGNKMEHSYLQ